MKRFIIAGSVAALAFVGMTGTANASEGNGPCFGQVHKTINAGAGSVGDFVKVEGGQGKKAAASACRG